MKEDKIEKTTVSSIYTKEEKILLESAKIASSKAIRTSTALGLTIKIIEDGKIIEVYPDKKRKVVGYIAKPNIDLSFLQKGMTLKRKSK
ncbi:MULTISPECIES: hypothetical protein [Chitinophagaceae]